MKLRRVCVGVCSWLRFTSLAVKWSSCSWSSTLTRSTYSTGLWIAATQAPTSSPQAASKPSLQSVAAGTNSQPNTGCSFNRGQMSVHVVLMKGSYVLHSFFSFCGACAIYINLDFTFLKYS